VLNTSTAVTRMSIALSAASLAWLLQTSFSPEPGAAGSDRASDRSDADVSRLSDSLIVYRGRLSFRDAPINAVADVEFRLYASDADPHPIAPPVFAESWPVSDGLLLIGLDFGEGVDVSGGGWLEVAVDGVILSPRQFVPPRGWSLKGEAVTSEDGGRAFDPRDAAADSPEGEAIHHDISGVDRPGAMDDLGNDAGDDAARDRSRTREPNDRRATGGDVGTTLPGGGAGEALRGGRGGDSMLPGGGSGDSGSPGGGGDGWGGFLFNAGDRFLSATDSVYINIDADNNNPDNRLFEIGKNRYADAGGASLFRVNEDGNVGVGTTSPLADLHIASTMATLRLEDTTTSGGYTDIYDAQPTQLRINKTNTNGFVLFDLNPMPTDGVSAASIRFFRETNTVGPKAVNFLRGNFTTQTSASIGVDGANSWFQAHGGNLGIGTAGPTRKLHVEGNGTVGLYVTNNGANVDSIDVFASGSGIGLDVAGDSSSTGDQIRLQPRGSSRGLNIYSTSSNSAITAWNDGSGDAIRVYGEITFDNFVTNLPMINMFDEGTTNPARMVLAHSPAFPDWGLQYIDSADDFAFVGSGAERVRIDLNGSDVGPASGGHIVTGALNGLNIGIDNNEIQARDNGVPSILHFQADGGTVLIGQNSGGSATLVTPVIQITGGSDFSEMFDVGGEVASQPGMVVVIDAANPGRLVPSTAAYDRTVAGIISGAGGVATGMTMGHDGTIADGEHPVALTGRVYCLVDASTGAIEPGDMLTTSNTPGHAMKAGDLAAAQGAIIGKAMTSLDEGEVGLVLVLVNLQ
jgi:hypothetical protein